MRAGPCSFGTGSLPGGPSGRAACFDAASTTGAGRREPIASAVDFKVPGGGAMAASSDVASDDDAIPCAGEGSSAGRSPLPGSGLGSGANAARAAADAAVAVSVNVVATAAAPADATRPSNRCGNFSATGGGAIGVSAGVPWSASVVAGVAGGCNPLPPVTCRPNAGVAAASDAAVAASVTGLSKALTTTWPALPDASSGAAGSRFPVSDRICGAETVSSFRSC